MSIEHDEPLPLARRFQWTFIPLNKSLRDMACVAGSTVHLLFCGPLNFNNNILLHASAVKRQMQKRKRHFDMERIIPAGNRGIVTQMTPDILKLSLSDVAVHADYKKHTITTCD